MRKSDVELKKFVDMTIDQLLRTGEMKLIYKKLGCGTSYKLNSSL